MTICFAQVRTCCLLLLFVLLPITSMAQPANTYEMIYSSLPGFVGQYGVFSLDQTADEGTISMSSDLAARAILFKTDIDGNLIWTRGLDAPYLNWRRDLSVDETHNQDIVWTSGFTNIAPAIHNTYVSSCNQFGVFQWGRTYVPLINSNVVYNGSATIIEQRHPAFLGDLVVGGNNWRSQQQWRRVLSHL